MTYLERCKIIILTTMVPNQNGANDLTKNNKNIDDENESARNKVKFFMTTFYDEIKKAFI